MIMEMSVTVLLSERHTSAHPVSETHRRFPLCSDEKNLTVELCMLTRVHE